MEVLSRILFGVAGGALMILAVALILYAGSQVIEAFWVPESVIGSMLLDAIGYVVIAIAVFDVAKYLLEEEVQGGRQLRTAHEARQSMTRFMTTIAIAVFLEALVTVFQVSKEDITKMIFPTLLLVAGILLILGLGVFQRLTAAVEKELEDKPRRER